MNQNGGIQSNIRALAEANLPDSDLLEREIKTVTEMANMAIAWGNPDSESTGYSSREFIQIIRKQQDIIKTLRKVV